MAVASLSHWPLRHLLLFPGSCLRGSVASLFVAHVPGIPPGRKVRGRTSPLSIYHEPYITVFCYSANSLEDQQNVHLPTSAWETYGQKHSWLLWKLLKQSVEIRNTTPIGGGLLERSVNKHSTSFVKKNITFKLYVSSLVTVTATFSGIQCFFCELDKLLFSLYLRKSVIEKQNPRGS